MFEPESIVPKKPRVLATQSRRPAPYDPKQRRLMLVALALLLVALGLVLYRNRDFWFPDTQEADSDQPVESSPKTAAPDQAASTAAKAAAPVVKPKHHLPKNTKPETKDSNSATAAPPASANTTRTVLPPLEVEVIAGDTHRTVQPGTNSVHVELQPGVPPQAQSQAGGNLSETAANLTSNAAERVQMSADTAEVVSHPVKPGYPLLARQMKVQGSVILRALIGKDGAIQDLHVVSGPTILASAAQDAVRQWRFKPHYQGNEAVETQAKITVNFTISTN